MYRCYLVIFLFFISYTFFINRKKEATIYFYDVGQGDAILIDTQKGNKIIIDGGPNFEVSRYLSKFFPFNNCEIELLILTHPHYDHIAGLNRLLEVCSVNGVMYHPSIYESSAYVEWLLLSKSINRINPDIGQKIYVDEIEFLYLWPPRDFKDKNVNNDSIVLLLKHNIFEVLFMGDIEYSSSRKINIDTLKKNIQGGLEVYKVPHHGAKNALNQQLLNEIPPSFCVVSAGKNNKFGHPHMEVLNYLENLNCNVLRTDELGTIEILIK